MDYDTILSWVATEVRNGNAPIDIRRRIKAKLGCSDDDADRLIAKVTKQAAPSIADTVREAETLSRITPFHEFRLKVSAALDRLEERLAGGR